MIEKLKTINPYDETEIDMDIGSVGGLVYENTPLIQKINELVDAVNSIVSVQEKLIDSRFVVETKHEEPAENVQDDHYWFKQQERYKAALVLIRDLTGAGMSYHDIVVEMREIARWALDPHYKPLLIGRYNKEASEMLDVLRETKGGKNE